MAKFELQIKESVFKDLQSIPSDQVKRILEKIETLAIDPRPPGSEKLTNQERYRIRQGPYRILYKIVLSRIQVVVVKGGHRVGHRKDRHLGKQLLYPD
ncbi:MAG: type II toxin-antitoxin system RelE/ParE family toxin [Spirochaetales bacterium]|nr:type II toxin-antitoxin system RelE/ParE family toxin [Spirochaetales bacterium]